MMICLILYMIFFEKYFLEKGITVKELVQFIKE